MNTRTIKIKWEDVFYDARANTWKTGNLTPAEGGQHAEGQMDDSGVDENLAKRSFIDACYKLLESVKRFTTASSLPSSISNITSTAYTISLSVSDRNNCTDGEISAISHAFITAHVCADWYKMTNNSLEKDWVAKMQEAEMRLLNAIYKKTAPTLS